MEVWNLGIIKLVITGNKSRHRDALYRTDVHKLEKMFEALLCGIVCCAKSVSPNSEYTLLLFLNVAT